MASQDSTTADGFPRFFDYLEGTLISAKVADDLEQETLGVFHAEDAYDGFQKIEVVIKREMYLAEMSQYHRERSFFTRLRYTPTDGDAYEGEGKYNLTLKQALADASMRVREPDSRNHEA
jgi:hypothetical protein